MAISSAVALSLMGGEMFAYDDSTPPTDWVALITALANGLPILLTALVAAGAAVLAFIQSLRNAAHTLETQKMLKENTELTKATKELIADAAPAVMVTASKVDDLHQAVVVEPRPTPAPPAKESKP